MHFVYEVLQTKRVKFEITPQEITLRFVKDGQNTAITNRLYLA
jgi:hypothetical protein